MPSALFGLDTGRVREQRVEAGEVIGEAQAIAWSERIAAADSLDVRRDILVGLVDERYADREPDYIAESVLSRLALAPHDDVASLAGVLGVQPRTLHRRCVRLFGYGLAALARLLRLQRFVARGATEESPTLAGLAVGAGYVDQAHLGRECRRVTGRTPAVFLGSTSTFPDMSDPYKNGRRLAASIE
ncbi:MAG: helix-turn-helix domain-containing protein [Nocardioides sp.]|nr:helix-turn-helix domain-containing protein [Nocardioides sp.]